MERQKDRAIKYSKYQSKYEDRWANKQYDKDNDKQIQEKKHKRRFRNSHKNRDSSWVSQSTPLEDLVSLSPRMKVSGRNLFAFHIEDKFSRLFDDSSDEKENNNDAEEEEKIVMSPEKPQVSTITKETLRLHEAKLKEKSRNANKEEKKEDSSDSFTSISTDIQNAIHYDLLENEIYHTCNFSKDSGSTS